MERTIIFLGVSALLSLGAGVGLAQNMQCAALSNGCTPYACYVTTGTCGATDFDCFQNVTSQVGYCYPGAAPCDDKTKVLICTTWFYVNLGVEGLPCCAGPNVCDVLENMSPRCKPS